MKIFKVFLRSILPFLVVLTFSCAVITVNIYFPARDVEKAYENLEDQLMNPSPEKQTPGQQPEQKEKTDKDTSRFLNPASWFVQTAYAGNDLAAKISRYIMKMPEVVSAYRRMGKRISKINRLRDKKLVGEANSGFLAPLVKLNRDQALLLEAENHDRSIIILGMAKAILKINHLEISKKNLDKVYPQAAAQFAKLRRKKARRGWKIQLPNGTWIVKK